MGQLERLIVEHRERQMKKLIHFLRDIGKGNNQKDILKPPVPNIPKQLNQTGQKPNLIQNKINQFSLGIKTHDGYDVYYVNSENEPLPICEWLVFDGKFVEKGTDIFELRVPSLGIGKFKSPKTGFIEIIYTNTDYVKAPEELQELFSLHKDNTLRQKTKGDRNNVSASILKAEIILDKIEDTNKTQYLLSKNSGYLPTLNWLVSEGNFIKKGQHLFEALYLKNRKINIYSPIEGYIEIQNYEEVIDKMIDKPINLFTIYTNDNHRKKYKFVNKYEIINDKFNHELYLFWTRIGPNFSNPILPDSYNNKSITLADGLGITIENKQGKDELVIHFDRKLISIFDDDRVLFLFENDKSIAFQTSQSYRQLVTKNIGVYRIPIEKNEIDLFANNNLSLLRIEFKKRNVNKDFDLTDSLYIYKSILDTQYVIRSLFSEYISVTESKIKPFIEARVDIDEQTSNSKNISKDGSCFLYLMVDTTNNYHKIGISNKPEYREKTLQSEKPTIQLVAAKQFPSRLIARSIESALHTAFKESRLRGEWFDLNEDEINQIKNTLEK